MNLPTHTTNTTTSVTVTVVTVTVTGTSSVQTTANLGPLLATFTPSAYCFTPYINSSLLDVGVAYYDPYGVTQHCDGNGSASITDAPACYPSANPYDPAYTVPVYSPGAVCPSGFSINRTYDDESVAVFDYGGGLAPGETLAVCCPSGYDGILGNYCRSPANNGHVLTGYIPSATNGVCGSAQTSVTVTSADLVVLQAVNLVRKSTDPPFVNPPPPPIDYNSFHTSASSTAPRIGFPISTLFGIGFLLSISGAI